MTALFVLMTLFTPMGAQYATALDEVGKVPPSMALAVYLAAERHAPEGYDKRQFALELGGLLIAENKSQKYDGGDGRYGHKLERGVFQLDHTTWGPYCGLTEEELRQHANNIDCAAQMWAYTVERHRTKCVPKAKEIRKQRKKIWKQYGYAPSGTPDPINHGPLAHFRCGKKSRESGRCQGSVGRVQQKIEAIEALWPAEAEEKIALNDE